MSCKSLRAAVAFSTCLTMLGISGVSAAISRPDISGWSWDVVIVQASAGGPALAAQHVESEGGSVIADLPIVDGVAARIPSHKVQALRARPGIRAVTPNSRVELLGTTSGGNESSINSVFNREINAPALWNAGYRGAGVRIAVVDTGVSPVQDLANRIVPVPSPRRAGTLEPCVNFSGEEGCQDSYGHGTFISGLIAGNGAQSGGLHSGVAPAAEIVSLKLAGRDGSADVTKVLAAIQWVVSFKNQLNIRVLNLSLGTNSPVSYKFDPLNFAVERAWRKGIFVVVSAGNLGPAARSITKPADDPLVVSVGATDDRETPATSDDRLPSFSGRGPTKTDLLAKPDVVAPGGRVISVIAPDSEVERRARTHPLAGGYRRGSGTSMSAGIVSGAAALLLSAHPTWTPDRLKFALMATANTVAERDPMAIGSGIIDVAAAAFHAPPGLANQNITVLSDATGTLDGSRRDVLVTAECRPAEKLINPDCDHINGNETGQGSTFDAAAYTADTWTSDGWYDSQWVQAGLNGSSWYGSSWYGSSWYGSSWYGSSWYGSFESKTEYGRPQEGSAFLGAWL